MNKFKLGIVIVTYNPDINHDITQKLEKYKQVCSLIVLVDNNSDKPILFEKDDKIVLIKNRENLGHAKALNIGCMYLLNHGFTHALLLGQDSIIQTDSILRLAEVAKKENFSMVSPQIIGVDKNIEPMYLIRTKHWFKKERVNKSEIKEVYINITSGSTLNLKIWQEVGGFWDDLFIEKVDDEYALRLRKFGHRVAIVGDAYLIEPYGNSRTIKKLGVIWHPTFHKAWRLHLLYRNKVYLRKEYFFTEFPFIVFQSLALLKRFVTILLVEDNKKDKVKNIISGEWYGLVHSVKRNEGPYKCEPNEFADMGKADLK